MRNTYKTTKAITMTAMLAALSYVLAFIEIPVPLSPSFAKFDLSDFPALVGAFTISPFAGVAVELVKNLLQILTTSTGGIGELANFMIGATFVFTTGSIYQLRKKDRNVWLPCVVGSIAMGIMAAITNYYVLLPLFQTFMPIDELILSFRAFIPFITTKLDIVLYNALPFNICKGLLISIFTMFVYKRLSPVLKGA